MLWIASFRVHEEQSSEYAKSKLKHLDNAPLPFVFESTGPRPAGNG